MHDDRLKAQYGDKVMDAMRGLLEPTIHGVVRFTGRLDAERLARAVRLAMNAEPVLGCRYVSRFVRPYWEPASDEARAAAVDVLRVADPIEAAREFFGLPFERSRGPALRARLLQADADTLCVTMNHLAGDGGGFKQALYLLASIYRELGRDAAYTPPVSAPGDRSLAQVTGRFDREQKRAIVREGVRDARRFQASAHPILPYDGHADTVRVLRLDPARVQALRELARSLGATVNDVVVAAWYTALYEAIRPPEQAPITLVSTVDLRRYLPDDRAPAITNLSGFAYVAPEAPPGATLAETAARVRDLMNGLKNGYLGLGDFVVAPALSRAIPSGLFVRMARASFRSAARKGHSRLGITNTGRLSDDLLDFGAPAVADAYIVPLRCVPPMVSVAVSGFRDALSFVAFYQRTPNAHDPVADVLERFVALLPS